MSDSFRIPNFQGEIHTDEVMRILYATDASVYRELPRGVILPRNTEDVGAAVIWAAQNRIPLIPRGGGTSLAGQVVGDGVVMDVSKYLNRVLEIDPVGRQVKVEPGVVRNQLNAVLRPHNLFFAPITSTASRANMGGMIGNNSCGSNSIQYGSVRDHLIEVGGYLSDGSKIVCGSLTASQMTSLTEEGKSREGSSLESRIYSRLYNLLSDKKNQESIRKNYPPPQVTRRNTGYCLDGLLDNELFGKKGRFNLCRLIAGSEGTLMLVTEAVLGLEPLPGGFQAVAAVHCGSVAEALQVNLIALNHYPSASELIDDFILQCSKRNLSQRKNRRFVVGDPRALLAVEFLASSREELEEKVARFKRDLAGHSLPFPILYGKEVSQIWQLRAAGLGVMNTLPGDSKPQSVVEDAAVDPCDLPSFITDYDREMAQLGLTSVYYGHAGDGELHLRPICNLKTAEGKKQFRRAAEVMAGLVTRYRGSLSGEHGDGRLRGEFIPQVMGTEITALFQEVKKIFDPAGIFNPGKITLSPLWMRATAIVQAS